MELKHILRIAGLDPDARRGIGLVRHRPFEPQLARVMPWLISERPELFEIYQSVPGRPEASIRHAEHLVSFIGLRPGTAHFVGIYRVVDNRELNHDAFWAIRGNQELRQLGYEGFTQDQANRNVTVHQFTFELLPAYQEWRGKLMIDFPPPERSWFRWVNRGTFPIRAVLEESAFDSAPPDWHEIDLSFVQLAVLPLSWRQRLAEWRGIYLIFDEADGKSYVGSACGQDNLLGRWMAYAHDGNGGNRDLVGRDAASFRFTILERLSPDMPRDEVTLIENNWKTRLHTRAPFGLNAN